MTWDESFKNLAADLARIYKLHPEQILMCLKFESVSGSLNESYLSFVRMKELPPLESLPVNEKVRIWNKAKQYGTEKQECILISRSIYLLEEITK